MPSSNYVLFNPSNGKLNIDFGERHVILQSSYNHLESLSVMKRRQYRSNPTNLPWRHVGFNDGGKLVSTNVGDRPNRMMFRQSFMRISR
jgi:hypothetical protein